MPRFTDSNQRCSACGGVYHPASGHAWSEETVLCGPCTREFFDWLKVFTAGKGKGKRRGLAFYDYAVSMEAAVAALKAKKDKGEGEDK